MADRVAVLLVWMFTAACGGSHGSAAQPQQPAAPPAQPAPVANQAPADPPAVASKMATLIAKLDEFKGQLCACHDAPCAQHVSDDMSKWGQEQAEDPVLKDMKP